MSTYKYTLVQHSAGAIGDPSFSRAVEAVSLTPAECTKVIKAGGLILNDYAEAEDREQAENYPPGVEGLVPRVRGSFNPKLLVGGLPLYVP